MGHPLLHWIPYRLHDTSEGVFFEWMYLGDLRMTDPFFEDTLAKCRSNAVNSRCMKHTCSLKMLLEWSETIQATQLSAFIFHTSRCGSTMLSQLLAIPNRNIVVSEAPILDQILQHPHMPSDLKAKVFGVVVRFLGTQRFDTEKHLVVKLDCWHLSRIDFLRSTYPDLPFLLMFRTPEEILKSHDRKRGMHMIPSLIPPSVFNFHAEEVAMLTLADYGIKVLKRYFQSIKEFYEKDNRSILCDYNQGLLGTFERFVEMSNIRYTKQEYDDISTRLATHSKYPNQNFSGDTVLNLTSAQNEEVELSNLYKSLVSLINN